MNSKKKVMILSIIIVLITIVTGISLSYAYWASIHVGNNSNVLNSGCLNVEFKSLTNDIGVSRAYPGYFGTDYVRINGKFEPIYGDRGNDLYLFTITNTCTTVASYDINLDTLEGSNLDSKYLSIQMLGYNIRDERINNEDDLGMKIDSLYDYSLIPYEESFKKLSEYDIADTTIDNAIYSNKLYNGVLGGREQHLFGFYAFIDESVDDNESMDKTWNGKVVVNSTSVDSTNLIKVNFDTGIEEEKLGYISVEPGDKYGELPYINREGYILDYWYIDNDENNRVCENTIVTKNNSHTLSAKWVEGTLLRNDAFFGLDNIKQRVDSVTFYNGDFNSLDILSEEEYDNWRHEYFSGLLSGGHYDDNLLSKDRFPLYYIEVQENGNTPVYFWLNDSTLFYYTEAPLIYFNSHDGFGGDRNQGEVPPAFYRVESLDLSRFRTDRMKDMSQMFYGCESLKTIDFSYFNTSNVLDMSDMFSGCRSLESLDLSSFNTSNVYYMDGMFGWCNSLKALNIMSFNTSSVINMESMFNCCELLESLDLSSFNTSNVSDMSYMFSSCEKLNSLDVGTFDTSNVLLMRNMFSNCDSIVSLDLSNFNTSKVKGMYELFSSCDCLESVNLSSFDTSNVTDMMWMFEFCTSLVTLDLSSFDVSNVSTMRGMFEFCNSLVSINFEGFSPSNVKNMSCMFEGCKSLKSLDLLNFNTSNCTTMDSMFYDCTSLEYVDLSGFDTRNVNKMNSMFRNCSSLSSLDLSSFNTSNVTDMNYMFLGCSGLTTLDLSSFNTSKVSSFRYVFDDTDNLRSITLNCSNAVSLKNHINYLYSSKTVICA